MKRVYILVFLLLATAFTSSDASVTPAQDPAKVNAKFITVKIDNPRATAFTNRIRQVERTDLSRSFLLQFHDDQSNRCIANVLRPVCLRISVVDISRA